MIRKNVTFLAAELLREGQLQRRAEASEAILDRDEFCISRRLRIINTFLKGRSYGSETKHGRRRKELFRRAGFPIGHCKEFCPFGQVDDSCDLDNFENVDNYRYFSQIPGL